MVAPVVAALVKTLMMNGLGTIASAVVNKGKEAVEEKLGVNLDEMIQTPAGVQALHQSQIDHEEFLINAAIENRKLDIEEQRVANANTDSARDMNAEIQTSADALMFVKILPYVLDAAVVVGTLGLGLFLFFFEIPVENKELAYTIFGGLMVQCGTIINFHRGSTASNKNKDSTIESLSRWKTK